MYLYFYLPDSLTHRKLLVTHIRNKMVDGKVFGPKPSRSSTLNLSLAAELNFNSRKCSCASSKMSPISHCNVFLASHL